MSWTDLVERLMAQGEPIFKESGAILGCSAGQEGFWAGQGDLMSITAAEIRAIANPNRDTIFTDGVRLAGVKCRVIRDMLYGEEGYMIVMSMNQRNICIAKSKTALVVLQGCESIHSRELIKDTTLMAKHLSDNNM